VSAELGQWAIRWCYCVFIESIALYVGVCDGKEQVRSEEEVRGGDETEVIVSMRHCTGSVDSGLD
jgi:hypothetical protein